MKLLPSGGMSGSATESSRILAVCDVKGPSIYDVHTEGEGGGQAQVDACGRGRGVQPHVDVHTEN